MADFKNSTKKKMIKEWKRSYKTSLKEFIYERNLESSSTNPNNDTSSGKPHYDSVNEVWIYPTGTPDNTSTTLTGLMRSADKDTYKDPDLLSTDKKFTVLFDDFIEAFGSEPQTSDIIIYKGTEYRVKKAKEDSIECFYHIFTGGV